MATLHLPLKGAYFDQIKSGEKIEEYRLVTPFWTKRLEGRAYDRIELAKGYPPKGDTSRRITRLWRGARKTTITHSHSISAPAPAVPGSRLSS
ncbi:RNA-binding protein [Rhodovulum sulfidophilum]|nr:RNA-binding protein [Rhodovulum sulfidophilum]